MDGIQLLKELRTGPKLQGSIVFILTTSKSERDKMQLIILMWLDILLKKSLA